MFGSGASSEQEAGSREQDVDTGLQFPLSSSLSPVLRRARTRGFSLIELVAVLALIAIVVVTMTFGLTRGLQGTKVRAASRDMAAAMRYTRGQAIIKREERTLLVDVETKSYTAPGKGAVKLPDEMDLHLLTARGEFIDDDERVGGIRFFPDGSSSGGRVRLVSGAREWVVNVAWLTGEISLDETRQ